MREVEEIRTDIDAISRQSVLADIESEMERIEKRTVYEEGYGKIGFVKAGTVVEHSIEIRNPKEIEYRDLDGRLKSLDAIWAIVKMKPSVQPEQQWILCSERLPEDVKNGEEYPTLIYCTGSGKVDAGWYEAEVHKWWDLNCDVTVDNVIAWMPLPKPFRGDNNEIN